MSSGVGDRIRWMGSRPSHVRRSSEEETSSLLRVSSARLVPEITKTPPAIRRQAVMRTEMTAAGPELPPELPFALEALLSRESLSPRI